MILFEDMYLPKVSVTMSISTCLRLTLLYVIVVKGVLCFSKYQGNIPNGNKVPNPCNPSEYWAGVGHRSPNGGGKLNPFALDFKANNYKWNKVLCEKDSDNDDVSNGVELGDPDCLWTPGDDSLLREPEGHPGICNPWSSIKCLGFNGDFRCTRKPLECGNMQDKDVTNFSVTLQNYTVPSDMVSSYVCMNIRFPLDKDSYMFGFESNFDHFPGVHHILLLACPSLDMEFEQPLNVPYRCQTMTICTVPIVIASIGTLGHCYKGSINLGSSQYKYGLLQVHCHNENLLNDLIVSPGLKLYLSPNPPSHDLGILTFGKFEFDIPPKRERFSITSTCDSNCTGINLKGPVTVTSAHLHMHYLGRSITLTINRGGKRVGQLKDLYYSFDNPHHLEISDKESLVLMPGDTVTTTCTYNSLSSDKTTSYGIESSDEMCLIFVVVYPKSNIGQSHCNEYGDINECHAPDWFDRLDGCPLWIFHKTPDAHGMIRNLTERCVPYTCLDECRPIVDRILSHPCFRGSIGKLVMRYMHAEFGSAFFSLLSSCDSCFGFNDDTPQKPVEIGRANGQSVQLFVVLVASITSIMI